VLVIAVGTEVGVADTLAVADALVVDVNAGVATEVSVADTLAVADALVVDVKVGVG
jgi:hypothetical protein